MTESAVAVEYPAAHLVEAGDGAAVLCLHGWGASLELFAPLIAALGERRHLIAPDFPGFGGTPPPPAPWAVADYADWTAALLGRLGLTRVDIVGHSFGARVAIALAARRPELVRHLVLPGAAGVRRPPSPAARARIRLFKATRRVSQQTWLPSRLRAAARRRVERSGSRDYRAATGVMRGTFVRVVNEDLRPLMPRVGAPTLLVWGDRDDETPLSDGREMERLIPDAGLVVFAGASHYAYIEQGERFAHIVETFLASPL